MKFFDCVFAPRLRYAIIKMRGSGQTLAEGVRKSINSGKRKQADAWATVTKGRAEGFARGGKNGKKYMDYVYSVITIFAGCGVFLLGFKLLSDNMELLSF